MSRGNKEYIESKQRTGNSKGNIKEGHVVVLVFPQFILLAQVHTSSKNIVIDYYEEPEDP
jgi:hypothetical protein